jgi:predicted O-methyltransferase YrrM
MVSKTLRLLSLLPRNPAEFCERVAASLEVRAPRARAIAYQITLKKKAVSQLSKVLGADISEKLQEPELARIEAGVKQAQPRLAANAPFSPLHNGGSLLARLSYAIARVLRPQIVIESGVCYGVTSAHLLQALHVNAGGHLHSIDLPPLGKNADAYVGSLVPAALRTRWTLHRGTTKRRLRPLLESLPALDLFLHDSLHTYQNMRMEFSCVWPKLRSGGVVIADDVEGNAAFYELAQLKDTALALVLRETGKDSYLGIAVKR